MAGLSRQGPGFGPGFQGFKLILQPLDEALVEREPVRQLMTAKFPYLEKCGSCGSYSNGKANMLL